MHPTSTLIPIPPCPLLPRSYVSRKCRGIYAKIKHRSHRAAFPAHDLLSHHPDATIPGHIRPVMLNFVMLVSESAAATARVATAAPAPALPLLPATPVLAPERLVKKRIIELPS